MLRRLCIRSDREQTGDIPLDVCKKARLAQPKGTGVEGDLGIYGWRVRPAGSAGIKVIRDCNAADDVLIDCNHHVDGPQHVVVEGALGRLGLLLDLGSERGVLLDVVLLPQVDVHEAGRVVGLAQRARHLREAEQQP